MKIISGDAVESALVAGKSYWLVAFDTDCGFRVSKCVFRSCKEAERFIISVLAGDDPHIVDIRKIVA